MIPISSEERAYRAALYEVDGIGPARMQVLLSYFDSAKAIWDAGTKKLSDMGLPKKSLKDLEARRKKIDPKTHLQALVKLGIRVIVIEDEEYPDLLKEIDNAPRLIFVKGHFEARDGKAIAVVGTRKPTPYGRGATENLVEQLVANGFTIISGLARGIDGIAHRAALEAGGRTVGVLGGGLDRVYPPEHAALAEKVSRQGVVVSEFAVGKLPAPGNFPVRNRIISGLSQGVLVVEGASQSGTKITARLASEQGREVFAVPGPITSRQSQAPADLIKLGAKLVTDVADILEEFPEEVGSDLQPGKKMQIDHASLQDPERQIVEVLLDGNQHVDDLVRMTKLKTHQVSSSLTMLEIKGLVKHLGSAVYSLRYRE